MTAKGYIPQKIEAWLGVGHHQAIKNLRRYWSDDLRLLMDNRCQGYLPKCEW